MNISTPCDNIDSITRIHFLDLLLRFLKFNEKFVNLHQMLHLVTDGFFIYVISAENLVKF